MSTCSCSPCVTPAYGAHGMTHCAECCMGTRISEYDPECPISEHRAWAARQFAVSP